MPVEFLNMADAFLANPCYETYIEFGKIIEAINEEYDDNTIAWCNAEYINTISMSGYTPQAEIEEIEIDEEACAK